jgi:hypothetical protein
MFQKATKKKSKLRLAIDGPSGAGKTYTALIAATAIADGGKIAVIDTERGSASLYSDKFNFDVLELNTFSPQLYIDAINEAEKAGYKVIVIDSLSHAWEGEGGVLDMHEDATNRSTSKNSYTAWAKVTPLQRELVDAMLQSPSHVIATMRSKMDYIQVEEGGKKEVKKVGMAPIQRQGMEYEFTIVGDMDTDHNFVVSKTRCDFIADKVLKKPDQKFFKSILDWLNSGEDVVSHDTPKSVPPPPPVKAPEIKSASGRPYSPEQLKKRLVETGVHDAKATQDDRNMVAANLNMCFQVEKPDQIRHAVLKYLTGKASTKDISDGTILALKRWLHATQDSGGEWTPDPMSVKEAQSVWTEAQKADGQIPLV